MDISAYTYGTSSYVIRETDSLGRRRDFATIGQLRVTSAAVDLVSLPVNDLASYPNPFNASTTVLYTIAIAQDISIDVYDMTGRRVRQIASEYSPAGQHALRFDAGTLASGMYMVRISGPEVHLAHRIQLLK